MQAIGRWSVASFISIVLGIMRIGITVGLILGVAASVALPLLPERTMTVTVPVSFSLDTPAQIRPGRPGFGFEILNEKEQARQDRKGRVDSVDGSQKIPTTDRRFIAANAIALVLLLALALFVITQLRAVLRTLIHGSPFVAANATRIRRVALAVIGGEILTAAIVFAENYYAMTHVTIAGLQFDSWPRVSLWTIGYGLIILVIAEVFRAGTRLDEEQSLTI